MEVNKKYKSKFCSLCSQVDGYLSTFYPIANEYSLNITFVQCTSFLVH